jgi:hypothetical protein
VNKIKNIRDLHKELNILKSFATVSFPRLGLSYEVSSIISAETSAKMAEFSCGFLRALPCKFRYKNSNTPLQIFFSKSFRFPATIRHAVRDTITVLR